MHKHLKYKLGFTTVELMIVIAIIAILMGIVIVGFGAWRQKTAVTEVKTSLISLNSALKNEITFKGIYPASVPTSYEPNTRVTISYSSLSTSYCVSATSTAVTSVVWYASSTSPTPSETPCS